MGDALLGEVCFLRAAASLIPPFSCDASPTESRTLTAAFGTLRFFCPQTPTGAASFPSLLAAAAAKSSLTFDGFRAMLTSRLLNKDRELTLLDGPWPSSTPVPTCPGPDRDRLIPGAPTPSLARVACVPKSLAIVGLMVAFNLSRSSFTACSTARRSKDLRFGVRFGCGCLRGLDLDRKGVGTMDDARSDERNDVGKSLGRSDGVSDGIESA